jgi:DNA-binding transcriptional LysR family regulator
MADRLQQSTLNNLMAFEVAARTGSFTQAASELSVSQPAVSHAMRKLEAELGVKLFERRHKGVDTTEAGRHLLEQVGLGLALIDQAVREVRSMEQGHQVTPGGLHRHGDLVVAATHRRVQAAAPRGRTALHHHRHRSGSGP